MRQTPDRLPAAPTAPPKELDTSLLDAIPAAGHGRGGGRGGGRRGGYSERKLTEGSIPKNLFTLAWPQMLAGALQAVDQISDLVWAGFIGSRALASIGVAQSWSQLFSTGRQGLDTATRAMVARSIGAENTALANHVAVQSLMLSGGLAAIMCVLGILFTELLMQILGVSDGVIAQGATYMRWQFVTVFTLTVFQSSNTSLQAAGDAVPAMRATMLYRGLHLVLSPLLVFGWLFFPELGLAGASMATAIAQATGAALNVYMLFSGRARLHLSLASARPDFPLLWRMFKLGAPASVTTMERSLAQIILVGLVTPFGDLALAAYSITNRMQMFTNLGAQGLAQACGILAGQNLGAQRPERARATVWWALAYVVAANFIVGGLIFTFSDKFLLIFTRDADLLAVAVPWLHVQVLAFMFHGSTQVFQQTFNTSGDTIIPMLVTLGSIWAVQQPLAIMLSGVAENWEVFGWDVPVPTLAHIGQMGIAWAAVLAMASRLVVYFPYFLWGPWHKKQVI